MPVKYMATKAMTTLMGMERAMISVGRKSSRNKSSTRMASAAPESRLSSTESMTMSM